jgi:hypothetical protein
MYISSSCKGILSVVGGSSGESGGGGGGGRISINVNSVSFSQNWVYVSKYLVLLTHGGFGGLNATNITTCRTGSSGTAYISLNYVNGVYGTIFLDNNNYDSFAMSILQEQPPLAMGLNALNSSVICMTSDFIFLKVADCSEQSADKQTCSFLNLYNSILLLSHSVPQLSVAPSASSDIAVVSTILLSANNVSLYANSQLSTYKWPLSTNIVCNVIYVDSSCGITFTYRLTINASANALLYGRVMQPQPTVQLTTDDESLRNFAGLRIYSSNVILGESSIYNLYVSTQNISIVGDIYPSNHTSQRCSLWGYSINICSLKYFKNSFLGNNSILIQATLNVRISGNIISSAVLLCGKNIVLNSDSTISANGLGCAIGDGFGAGKGNNGGS